MYKILIGLFLSVLCLQEIRYSLMRGSFTRFWQKQNRKKGHGVEWIATSWCGPCKMMMQEVLAWEDVGQFMNTRFVNVKLIWKKRRGGRIG